MNMNWEALAVIISFLSLGIVLYKEFLQGFKLHSSINQVIMIRLPAENKLSLIQDMLLDDLLSDSPSRGAQGLLANHPELKGAITSRNRDKLRGELIDTATRHRIRYNPPQRIVEHYWGDKRYAVSFLIPLVVYNSGRKMAFVSSLVLVARLKNQPEKKWAFSVFVEIEPKKILQRTEEYKDADRISNLFSGFAVGPGESVQVNTWFIPITDAKDRIISREGMKPGDYMLKVYGYDSRGKQVLTVDEVSYKISEQQLHEIFSGSESVNYVNIDEHVSNAVS